MLLTEEEKNKAIRALTSLKGEFLYPSTTTYYIGLHRIYVSYYASPVNPRIDLEIHTDKLNSLNIYETDDGPWWDWLRQEIDRIEKEEISKRNLKVMKRNKQLEEASKMFSVDPGPPSKIIIEPVPSKEPEPYKCPSRWDNLMDKFGFRKKDVS